MPDTTDLSHPAHDAVSGGAVTAPIASNAGLSTARAKELLAQVGRNEFQSGSDRSLFRIIGDIVKEPMFLLLLAACFLYFLLGEPRQGFLMLLAMVFVTAISIYQEVKSSRALAALKKYTEPKVKCIRDGQLMVLSGSELVPGDVILVEEGGRIPADARVLQSNDFSVNEAIITGESFPVTKEDTDGDDQLYQGSTVNSGRSYALVTHTGNDTRLGHIGTTAGNISSSPTLLQRQIGNFVKAMTIFGVSAFLLVWIVSYVHTQSLAGSLLLGLTLAMSAIPEEIPVAFSSFLALGAWRMARLGIIVRQPLTIENLGAVSVICLDKTGTLTENKMAVSVIYDRATVTEGAPEDISALPGSNVLWYARLACEPEPFDAMELAIVAASSESALAAAYRSLRFVHEYPLEGRPPMMTHVYQGVNPRSTNQGEDRLQTKLIVAAKGGPERIIAVCKLSSGEAALIQQKVSAMAAKGYRVLGVASATWPADLPFGSSGGGFVFPASQNDFDWTFEGLVALYDPPKSNVSEVLASWRQAGIRVKIISGDYAATVLNIAAAAGFSPVASAAAAAHASGAGSGVPSAAAVLTGDDLTALTDEQLQKEVVRVEIFARMFPEAKLRVIEALKANGETVAMTGDGVNDGLALKAAHIGIAMGDKGTETAREAADLILSDDNLERITDAIRHGRTIYENLKKAIRYLITIHIPILTTASIPMLLGWRYPTIFSPIHVIFLELIMGPTCSIFFEREPVEKNIMRQSPQRIRKGLLGRNGLLLTLAQGIIAATGLLTLYYYFMQHGFSLEYTRTLVFTTLIIDNILLTFVNRSTTETFAITIRSRNTLVVPVIILSVAFLLLISFLPFAKTLFGLTSLSSTHALVSLSTSLVTIGWFEIFKALFRRR